MTIQELRDELAGYGDNREILVEDLDGWKYDFMIADADGELSIAPLVDTKRGEG